MSTISNLEAAVLGLLCEEPMHPYEMEKCVEERSMREWTEISMSSIYKVPRKLEAEGLVKSRTAMSAKNRAQKTYSITPKGRKAVREKIKALLSEPERTVYQIDLATSNLYLLSKRDALKCLSEYEKKLVAGIKCYGELEKYLESCNCPKYRSALAKRPQHILRGELAWLREYRREIARSRELE